MVDATDNVWRSPERWDTSDTEYLTSGGRWCTDTKKMEAMEAGEKMIGRQEALAVAKPLSVQCCLPPSSSTSSLVVVDCPTPIQYGVLCLHLPQ
jgi:hypothetical protein